MRFGQRLICRLFLIALLLLALALPALADEPAARVVVARGSRIALTLPDGSAASWASADPSVATVSHRGQVTGRRAGETTVTATLADGRAYAWALTVTQPVTAVKLPVSRLTLERGQTAQLSPVIRPENATDHSLTFVSSDKSVARVDESGLVIALKAGRASITVAAANGKKARLTITVTQPVTGIAFQQESITIERGERLKLPAAIEPADATNKRVSYATENRAVATVASNGAITGRGAGVTWIVARAANGLTARIQVTVTQPVTRVSMPSSMKLDRGQSAQLAPAVHPDNATVRTLAFASSDESVARVDESGLVTALRAGKATITATAASGRKAALRLTVTQPVTGISLSGSGIVVNSGSSQRLTALVEPADASDRKVKWSTSDASVARVSSNGTVSGRRAGSAVITATAANGLTASCAVTVLQPVKRIVLNSTRLKLVRGSSFQAIATPSPADATDKTLAWASSNPAVAAVDETGLIAGLSDGSCVITVTAASGKSAAIKVSVTSVRATGVSLDRAAATLLLGEQLALSAAVLPENATDKAVRFASSDAAVASVDQNGVVTAHQAGQATVTASSADGSRFAQCRVTVRVPGQKRLEGVIIGINPGHQTKGDTTQDPVAPGSKKTRNRIGVGTSGVKTHTPEYQINLDVGLRLRDLLVSEGATVVMTRTANDVYVTNIQRAQMLNDAGVTLALQLHCDGSDNRHAHGVSVYTRNTGACARESAAAAQAILSAAVAQTGANNAGAHRSDNYMSLNYSATPSVLVEMGYLSNAAEDVKLGTAAYQQLLAEGICEGICRWLGR